MKAKATSNSSVKVVVNLAVPKKKRAPRKRKTTRGNLPPIRGIYDNANERATHFSNFPARVIYEPQPNAYANPPVQQFFMDPQTKLIGPSHDHSVKVEEVSLLGAQTPRPSFNEPKVRLSFGSYEEKPKGTPIPFGVKAPHQPEAPAFFGDREPHYNLRPNPKPNQFFTPL